jgi:hypothetical protein
MPRSVRFAFIAASDLVSAGGWYVRARALRTSGSVLRWTGVAALAVVLGISPAHQVSGQDQDVEAVIGTWEGQLALPGGAQLTVVFTVERSEDGALTGTLGSPDQGAQTAPWSSVTFEEGTLTLVASGVPGSPMFSGTRSEDGTVISGTFSQSGNQLPLELTKQE